MHPSNSDVVGTFALREEFYSVSKRGVIRGMHFQVPPADHTKIVVCMTGKILDVVLDLRPGKYYGRSWSIPLDSAQPRTLVLPPGVAHGFLSLSDNSIVLYKTDHEYEPDHDQGIRWNSFGFQWPIEPHFDPARYLSPRDLAHPLFADFESPFAAEETT